MAVEITYLITDSDSLLPAVSKEFDKSLITIGRFPDNDLVLEGDAVSGKHAEIRILGGDDGETPDVFLIDHGSTNGTILGGRRIRPGIEERVSLKTRFQIGDYLIKLAPSNGSESEKQPEPPARDRKATDAFSKIPRYTDDTTSDDDSEKYAPVPTLTPEAAKRPSSDNVISLTSRIEGDKEKPLEQFGPEMSSKELQEKPTQKFTASISGKLGSENLVELNFIAIPLHTIRGTVKRNGEPLKGVAIDAGSHGSTATGADGSFRIENIGAGSSYTLNARLNGYLIESKDSDGTLDADHEVTFIARKLLDIQGKVVHQGTPLAGVEINGGPLGTTTTDSDGIYRFKEVPEGSEYSLTASLEGYDLSGEDARPARQRKMTLS